MQSLKYAAWNHMLLLLMMAWALWRQRRSPAWDARVLRMVWLGLFLVSWQPFSTLLMGVLEWQSPVRPKTNPGVQAIVVLSGGLNVMDPPEPKVVGALSTQTRTLHAAWLYQHGWRLPVVVTGGHVGGSQYFSDVMEGILLREGVPAADIWKESAAESSADSARLVAAQLHPRGIRKILLVTEAYHMPRSVLLFQRAGFEVIASPCSFRTRDFAGSWQDWLLLGPRSMQMCESALHEWLAFVRARVAG